MTRQTSRPFKRQTDLHVLSHEVRTPLNAILGLLTMLEDQELPDAARSLLTRIEISAEGLNQQLNNAIEVQRIAAQKVIFAQRDFSLLQVAESSIKFYAAEAESKGVELTLQFDPRLIGKQFIGDQERLLQILSALVSNAVKFTDAGRVTLVIGLRKEKVATTQVVCRVIDTGIGIPESEIPLVTQANYQVQSATQGRPPGTGAGLYIASSLLGLLAAHLDINSSSTGTQVGFVLDLPASKIPPTTWLPRSGENNVQIYAPASAQIELISSMLQSLGLSVIHHTELNTQALTEQSVLRLVDYRVAAVNLVAFRRLCSSVPAYSLCLLSTEFEPATAMLAKGCTQWNSPYLPSYLLELCETAGAIQLREANSDNSRAQAKTLPEDLSNYTILCVDDSPTNLIVLVGALTKLGFNKVLRAKDGAVAVEVMREHPEVDLILMDFHMPRLNGAQAASQIRSEGSKAPILGVTALSEADLNAEIEDGDFDMVMTKPVRLPILTDSLITWLPQKV